MNIKQNISSKTASAVAFSPNGKYAAMADIGAGKVNIYEATSIGLRLKWSTRILKDCWGITFSPDSTSVAVTSSNEDAVLIYNVVTKVEYRIKLQDVKGYYPMGIAWTGSSIAVACNGGNKVCIISESLSNTKAKGYKVTKSYAVRKPRVLAFQSQTSLLVVTHENESIERYGCDGSLYSIDLKSNKVSKLSIGFYNVTDIKYRSGSYAMPRCGERLFLGSHTFGKLNTLAHLDTDKRTSGVDWVNDKVYLAVTAWQGIFKIDAGNKGIVLESFRLPTYADKTLKIYNCPFHVAYNHVYKYALVSNLTGNSWLIQV